MARWTKPPLTSADEFLRQYASKLERDGDCLVWTGAHSGSGYGVVNREGRLQPVHRLLYLLAGGTLPGGVLVDHICHRRDCVELTHLRAATNQENGRNRAGPQSNGTSGARGVSYDRRRQRWEAHVSVNGKKVFLGLFGTVEEARDAAVAGRSRYFGEFAGVA